MNNEPVAWMQHHYETEKVTKFSPVKVWEDDIPLYTHPTKTLTELSGVEIIGMSGKYDFNYEVDIIDFARAILRKAQEK